MTSEIFLQKAKHLHEDISFLTLCPLLFEDKNDYKLLVDVGKELNYEQPVSFVLFFDTVCSNAHVFKEFIQRDMDECSKLNTDTFIFPITGDSIDWLGHLILYRKNTSVYPYNGMLVFTREMCAELIGGYERDSVVTATQKMFDTKYGITGSITDGFKISYNDVMSLFAIIESVDPLQFNTPLMCLKKQLQYIERIYDLYITYKEIIKSM